MLYYFPDEPLEPWHAVFQSEPGSPYQPYTAASIYGKTVVDLGLADKYILLGYARGDQVEYHCIPHAGSGKNTVDYWVKLFDNNAGSC